MSSISQIRIEMLERRALLSGGPIGDEFRANSFTEGYQWEPAVATDADGDFVIVWESIHQDGDDEGVYGQRYAADGTPLGAEFQVHTETFGPQSEPDVAMDAAGNFVVVWRGITFEGPGPENAGIFAQRFDAAGVPQGAEFMVNADVDGIRIDPDVMMAANGSFVVTWYGSQAPNIFDSDIWARGFDAAGVPSGPEVRVNTFTANPPLEPAAAMDEAGNFAVVWRALQPGGDSWDIYIRRFDAAGSALSDEVMVNNVTAGFQVNPNIDVDAAGNFVVVWEGQDASIQGIRARRFNAAGAPLGDEFIVNTTTFGPQQQPVISVSAGGAFVVAWEVAHNDPDSSTGVYAQRFDAAGAPLGDEFRLSAAFAGPQVDPAIATDDQGDVVAAWSDPNGLGPNWNYDVLARRFNVTDTAATNVAGEFDHETPQHRLRLQFDDDVVTTLARSDVTVTGVGATPTPPAGTFSLAYDATTRLATLQYNGAPGGLPEGRYRATIRQQDVADVIGNRLAENFLLEFTFLRGDATGDGRVNLDDFNVLAANFGQSNRTFSQGDFNYDGVVNLDDFNILAARFGTSAATTAKGSSSTSPQKDDDNEDDSLVDLVG